ncbi:DNA damage-induced cell division inhibitor SosA [Staphylococcus pseudoxylosus]|uniref:DNA damage-induced cell division inhibitor SosA n=1 Tax=Staphylococcus pseudoxylosus TaxID=2282419 RepID=UPI0039062819
MMKNYKSQIKSYIIVLVVTMVLCALFILSAHNSANSEQTYEMTDHQMTSQSVNGEQTSQQVMAAVH